MTDFLKEPVLFVGDIDIDDIDLTMPPTSGEEYIKRVVIEAQQCDDIVVAKIDTAKLKKPTIDARPLTGLIEAPASTMPTLEWQNCQLSDFSNVRLRISRVKLEREKNHEWKKTCPSLPEIDDEGGWINFCLGTQENENKSHPPTLNIVLSMNHILVEQVLEYLVEEVEKAGTLGCELGKWLYALLAILEVPLNPDVCSCLRTLARTCSKLRANITTSNVGDESVSTMNLFICLVARYFSQLDLADP